MKKLILGFLCIFASVLAASCSEGEYNDLSCDPTVYMSECLSESTFMICDANTLELVVVTPEDEQGCKTGTRCVENITEGTAEDGKTIAYRSVLCVPGDTDANTQE